MARQNFLFLFGCRQRLQREIYRFEHHSKITVSIRTEKPLWAAVYYCKRKETKGIEFPVSYYSSEKTLRSWLCIEFHREPDTIGG
jgi:hypothetical protein